jgi:hypothetical protein
VNVTIFLDTSPGNCPVYERDNEYDLPAVPDSGELLQLEGEEHPRYIKERKWSMSRGSMCVELYLGQPLKKRGTGLRDV